MGSNFGRIGRPILVIRCQKFSLFLRGETCVENSQPNPNNEIETRLQELRKFIRMLIKKVFSRIRFVNTLKRIERQKHLGSRLPIGILGNGHVLLEVAPGLTTIMSATTLLNAIQAKTQRGQFTPNFSLTDSIVTSKEPTNNRLFEPLT